MTTTITKHGSERVRERIGVNKKSTLRQAELALERGLTHSDTKGKLEKWVNSKTLTHKVKGKAFCEYRIYNSKLFVFENAESNKLITVIEIPNNLRKIADKINKQKREGINGKE